MESAAPMVWPFVSEALILLLVIAVTALLIVIHRKNLLALLVAKQGELIDKLRSNQGDDRVNDRALFHIKDTAKWIQTRYRQEYGAKPDFPERVTDDKEMQQVEMMVALQTLGREIQAFRDELDPGQTWEEMQPALKKVLAPMYAAMGEEIPAVTEQESASGVDEAEIRRIVETEWRTKFEEAQARVSEMEEELNNAKSLHQKMLDEFEAQVSVSGESPELKEWLTSRRAGLGFGAVKSEQEQREHEDLMHKALADSLQKSEAEMKNLRNALAGQHEMVAKLKYKLSQEGGEAATVDSSELESLGRMLQESETCIKTLEMDLEETHEHSQKLEQEVAILQRKLKQAEMSRPTKELEDTIQTLEDAADEQSSQMDELRKELEEQKNVNFILRDQLGMPDEPVESSAAEDASSQDGDGDPAQ